MAQTQQSSLWFITWRTSKRAKLNLAALLVAGQTYNIQHGMFRGGSGILPGYKAYIPVSCGFILNRGYPRPHQTSKQDVNVVQNWKDDYS